MSQRSRSVAAFVLVGGFLLLCGGWAWSSMAARPATAQTPPAVQFPALSPDDEAYIARLVEQVETRLVSDFGRTPEEAAIASRALFSCVTPAIIRARAKLVADLTTSSPPGDAATPVANAEAYWRGAAGPSQRRVAAEVCGEMLFGSEALEGLASVKAVLAELAEFVSDDSDLLAALRSEFLLCTRAGIVSGLTTASALEGCIAALAALLPTPACTPSAPAMPMGRVGGVSLRWGGARPLDQAPSEPPMLPPCAEDAATATPAPTPQSPPSTPMPTPEPASTPAPSPVPVATPTVTPPPAPPAGAATVSVTTDRTSYAVGDAITICVTTSAAGQVRLIDRTPSGQSDIGTSSAAAGRSCITGTVSPPTGTECIRAELTTAAGTVSAEACFQVTGPTTAATPSPRPSASPAPTPVPPPAPPAIGVSGVYRGSIPDSSKAAVLIPLQRFQLDVVRGMSDANLGQTSFTMNAMQVSLNSNGSVGDAVLNLDIARMDGTARLTGTYRGLLESGSAVVIEGGATTPATLFGTFRVRGTTQTCTNGANCRTATESLTFYYVVGLTGGTSGTPNGQLIVCAEPSRDRCRSIPVATLRQ